MAVVRNAAFVDSSAWIALVRARDTRHREADASFRRALALRVALVTTNLVVAEVHRFLLHRAGVRAAAVALERISDSPHVSIVFPDAGLHADARTWLARFPDQELTYTAAASFAVMRSRKIEAALTYDRDFVVAGFRPWS